MKNKPKTSKILKFLKELKGSYYKNEMVYMEGSCFRLFCILKSIWNSAKPYYSELCGHWVTKIDGKYYDINGEISEEYISSRKFHHIKNKTQLSSAYIPTYERQTTSYDKYR